MVCSRVCETFPIKATKTKQEHSFVLVRTGIQEFARFYLRVKPKTFLYFLPRIFGVSSIERCVTADSHDRRDGFGTGNHCDIFPCKSFRHLASEHIEYSVFVDYCKLKNARSCRMVVRPRFLNFQLFALL